MQAESGRKGDTDGGAADALDGHDGGGAGVGVTAAIVALV